MWFRPLLRQVWEYSRYYLFWVCGSTPISAIPLFAGVLPQKCCSASGSTPIIKKQSVGPLLREYSRKSGPTILPGVLPKRLFLYTGSDLDMIYNLDILLPLDTLGVLPVLLFLVSGSTPRRPIFCQWKYLIKKRVVFKHVALPKCKKWAVFKHAVTIVCVPIYYSH